MKFTKVLFQQHVGWHFIKHWQIQGKRKVVDRGLTKSLTDKGIQLYKPDDILKEKQMHNVPILEDVSDCISKPVVFDSTHPNWHKRVCYTYKDNNVLLEGLDQAKVITKSVEVEKGLPQKYDLNNLPTGFDKRVKQIILNAHLFDAEQQKLPIVKDPSRPAWNFPRTYGITDDRVNKIIFSKLLQLIELTTDINCIAERNVLHNTHFSFAFEKGGDLLQLRLRSDMLLTSINPLGCISNVKTEDIELPNMYPIKYNNMLNKENIYNIQNIYPIKPAIGRLHPHTLFVHYNDTEVKALYEEKVSETQVLGRSLMKSFCVAASYAKQRFGDDTKILPEPITVQCIQTDGRLFDFGVLQLQTLDLDKESGIKNVWYHTSRIPLFTSCSYHLGKPILEGYNNSAFKYFLSFYNSI